MTTKMPQKRRSTTFKKGEPKPKGAGRAKGTRNKRTAMLKDAILTAATLVGQDGRGKDGLVGYLKMLAITEKAVYSRLLEKVLPMQVSVQDDTKRPMTAQEAVQRLRDRNLPVPPSLTLLASQASPLALTTPNEQASVIAAVLNDQHGDVETDDLDNRRSAGITITEAEDDPFMRPTGEDETDY